MVDNDKIKVEGIRPLFDPVAMSCTKCSLFAILALLLCSCTFFDPDGDLTGSVFIVTNGAGSYKFGLVHIYFFDRAQIKPKIDQIQQECNARLAFEKQTCDHDQSALIDANNALTKAKLAWSGAFTAWNNASDAALTAQHELQNKAADPETAKLLDPDATIQYFVDNPSEVNPDVTASIERFKKLRTAEDAADKDTDDRSGEINGASEAAKEAQAALIQDLSNLEEFPITIAQKAMDNLRGSNITVTSDADGAFKIRIPKKSEFIAVAMAQRTVYGNSTEKYFWIVPVNLNGEPSGTLQLDNENELLTGSSGSIVLSCRKPDTSMYDTSVVSDKVAQ